MRPSAVSCRSRSRWTLGWLAALFAFGFVAGAAAETWRGLVVAPEHRCSDYDKRRDYGASVLAI